MKNTQGHLQDHWMRSAAAALWILLLAGCGSDGSEHDAWEPDEESEAPDGTEDGQDAAEEEELEPLGSWIGGPGRPSLSFRTRRRPRKSRLN